jgi:hypothetical protein
MNRTMLLCLFLSALSSFAYAQEDPRCDIRDLDTDPTCPNPIDVSRHYKSCPKNSGWKNCDWKEAPVVAQISCLGYNGTVSCDAWPQSPLLAYTYIWSAVRGVEPYLWSSPSTGWALGTCTARIASVSVTVISPTGQSGQATSIFFCETDR